MPPYPTRLMDLATAGKLPPPAQAEIHVGSEVADEERNGWPMCLAGAIACPPEDVGGITSYGEFLQAMSDPAHEEHDAMWRWWGGPFDPRGFGINSANRDIQMWLMTRD